MAIHYSPIFIPLLICFTSPCLLRSFNFRPYFMHLNIVWIYLVNAAQLKSDFCVCLCMSLINSGNFQERLFKFYSLFICFCSYETAQTYSLDVFFFISSSMPLTPFLYFFLLSLLVALCVILSLSHIHFMLVFSTLLMPYIPFRWSTIIYVLLLGYLCISFLCVSIWVSTWLLQMIDVAYSILQWLHLLYL